MVKRAVFLDRDGVLNANLEREGRPVAPTSFEEFRLLPGVEAATARLKQAGFFLVVVTNQPDVSSGRTPKSVVDAMHAHLRESLPIDDIKVCYHRDEDRCTCRKPLPGLINEAAGEHNIDRSRSYLVGDRWRDIEAGHRAGCTTVLIDYGNPQNERARPDKITASLTEAADFILSHSGTTENCKSEVEMIVPSVDDLRIRIFADGADVEGIRKAAAKPGIQGFTTNPTLMRAAKVSDYKKFAQDVLRIVPDRPISFEVFADDFPTMEKQAREIASWGSNVYVKIPITNTKGESSGPLIAALSTAGIKLNVTAVLALDQVESVTRNLAVETPAVVSVFAGRIADTGRDPVPIMTKALQVLRARPRAELLWASPRELLNVFQADAIGCHIITVTDDLLKKLALVGKDLNEFSRETVTMFYRDAQAAGYRIPLAE